MLFIVYAQRFCCCCDLSLTLTFIDFTTSARKRLKFDDSHNSESSDDDDDPSQPIYERPPPKYSAERVIKILLQAEKSKVCQRKPTSISKSATYVVDVRNLRNQDDIKKDDFGIWNYSGSHPQPFKVFYKEGGEITVEKRNPGVSGANVVYLRCTHPSNADFKRLICFLTGTLPW